MARNFIKGIDSKENAGFVKSDLKNGMLVATKEKGVYVVNSIANGTQFLQRRMGWVGLDNFKDNLEAKKSDCDEYTIMAVYGPIEVPCSSNKEMIDSLNFRTLIWSRERGYNKDAR